MAIYNTVSIRFGNVKEGEKIKIGYIEQGLVRYIDYTIVNARFGPYQSEIGYGENSLEASRNTALNFYYSFNADFKHLGFLATYISGTREVLIEAPSPYKNRSFETFMDDDIGGSFNILYFFGKKEIIEELVIKEVSFLSSPINLCNKVKAIVTTNFQATQITSPINAPVLTNPFELELDRSQAYGLLVTNSQTTAAKTINTPPLLDIAAIQISINATPYSNSVTITYSGMVGLELEYSLDGQNWQKDNIFTGLLTGNFTLYVRDQFGCLKSKTFTIEESFTKIYVPYFYYSKSNSIRFAYRINFGDSGNYKNDENTLSCEADVLLPYKQEQLFQSADVITTQIKSNYTTNRVWIVKSSGDEIEIPVLKKTNNIGQKDAREARIVNLGNNQSGVFFLSGNTYDYDTNRVNGSYSLNGVLPNYGRVGNWVQLDGVYYEIVNVYYDENYSADMLVFNKVYTGSIAPIVVKCEFNFEEFEVYEFTIDMVDYIDQKFRVKIDASDSNFKSISMISETIYVKVKHEDTLEIRYYNDNNNDVFYQTGIKHLVRIPYTKVSGKASQSSEAYKTDSTAVLLNSEIYELNVFLFEPVTKEIWRKLIIALSSDNVTIDGVGYIKNADFETEGPLEKTNLYVLTAEMIKTGNVNSNKKTNYHFDSSNIEVPGLINATNDYLKYN